ncbi:MAG: glycosyltransferase [Planctomycetota bacterium]
MPRARVVVTAYRQERALEITLRGWLRQTTRDFALTVADDGSGPETAELVAAFGEEAKAQGLAVDHVWQADEGFRKNRILNEAVRRDRDASLFVFTDGDCIPPATFVERHLAAHEPWSFAVGGAVRLDEVRSAALDKAAVDAGAYEDLATDEDRRDLAKRARKSRWGTWLHRRNRPKILGLNMAWSRDLLEALNGFDERFVTWGLGEDSDLRDRAMRLRPRPRVAVLYGTNDVVHLWHPPAPGGRAASRAYYDTPRPVRCEEGLVRGGG